MEAITEDTDIIRKLCDLEAVLSIEHRDAHGVSIVRAATTMIEAHRSLIIALEQENARLKTPRTYTAAKMPLVDAKTPGTRFLHCCINCCQVVGQPHLAGCDSAPAQEWKP